MDPELIKATAQRANRPIILLLLGLVVAAASLVAHAEAPDIGPAANDGQRTRELWTTSRIVGSPEPPPPYTVRRAFPQLKFNQPVHLITGPSAGRLFLCEYPGRVVSFRDDQDVEETAPFLELRINIHSIAFHPQFDEHRYVFVFANTAPARKDGEVARNQILRFEVADEDIPRALPESRQLILEYRSDGHNGGEATFGPDGCLYISSGDGTGDSDGWNTGQDISDLPSGMLRIDVDHPDADRAYGIPDDNPFVEMENARGELWAYGFRNPWRFSFDRQTGELYVGDVGQDLWEMIYLVRRGGNYGWSVKEGGHDFQPLKKRGPTPILPPLIEHHHTEARSITGGHVYRGSRLPELAGAYIYGDYETGKIWGLRHDEGRVTWHKELADTSLRPSSFDIGTDGRFYLLAHQSGEIYELVPAPEMPDRPPFPRRLSETGLFASTTELIPAPGLIPYSVNAPQWCDGALAERFIALPGTSQMTFVSSGAWGFPEGAVLVKTLLVPGIEDATAPRRIETQIMTLQSDLWSGYTYIWNDAQTDAELAPPEGASHGVVIDGPATAGAGRKQPWRFVSRSECMVCHSRAAGFVLGLQTSQMNRDHPYAVGTNHQLRVLEQFGVFTKPLPEEPANLPRLADPYDKTAALAARARSYLHANCAHCHVGAGGGNAKIVLSLQTELQNTFLVGGRPLHADFGIPGAMLVAPGDPQRSVLYQRVFRRGNAQMPPLATYRVDDRAVDLIFKWIEWIEVPESARQDVDRAIAVAQGESGALSQWYVAGPLEKRLGDDVMSRIGDADSVLSSATDDGFPWRCSIGEGALCRVNLGAPSVVGSDRLWLARTDVILPDESGIQLLAVSTGIPRIWLNGEKLVAPAHVGQPASASNRFDAKLRKGRNRLLVEITSASDGTPTFHLNFRRKSPNARHEQLTQAALFHTGNAEHGRALFFDAKKTQCAKCHRVGTEGGEVGPDLTGVGARLSTARIIESVLEPSRTVAPQYRSAAIELADGRLRTGILVSETSDAVTIADDQGQLSVISKSQITVLQVQPKSLMPDGLEKTISAEEFVDLVTFLVKLTK